MSCSGIARQSSPVQHFLSRTQAAVLVRAYRREGHWVCPTPGLWAAAQESVLRVLRRNGYIDATGGPRLTDVGMDVARALVERGS